MIFGRAARDFNKESGPGSTMSVICCERNRKNYKALVEAVQPFQPHVKTLSGGFWKHVPAIARELGNAPALILLDPIGVATIPSDVWKPFLERSGKTDLFVVLHFAGVHRTGGWLLPNGEPNPDIARLGAASPLTTACSTDVSGATSRSTQPLRARITARNESACT